jgi:hypothetical protein
MYALINRLGADICKQYDWQQLNREHILITAAKNIEATTTEGSYVVTMADTTGLSPLWGLYGPGMLPFAQIVSVDSPTQVTVNMPADATGTNEILFSQVQYPLPDDWRKEIPQTEWDRSNRWPLMGPQTPQNWQSFKSGIVYAGPRERYRILGNAIALNPPPPNGLVLAFEYISNGFAISQAGVPQPRFLADTDTCVFDDSLMVAGLKVKFKQAKGLDVNFELSEFNGLLDTAKAQNRSAPLLNMSPNIGSVLITSANVPDGDWFFRP